VNHLTQTELEQMFSDLHLTWRVVDRSLPSEFIYMLEHTDAATAPDAKVRATQARRSD
jgi:hypothetical protein